MDQIGVNNLDQLVAGHTAHVQCMENDGDTTSLRCMCWCRTQAHETIGLEWIGLAWGNLGQLFNAFFFRKEPES